jgi:hypothetical protein
MKFVIGYLIDSLYIFSFEKLNNMFVKVIELLNDEKIQMTSKQRTEILNLVSKEEFFLKFMERKVERALDEAKVATDELSHLAASTKAKPKDCQISKAIISKGWSDKIHGQTLPAGNNFFPTL